MRLHQNTFFGFFEEGNFQAVAYEHSEMNTQLNILAINGAKNQFQSHYSGFIGIAPPNLEKTGEGELAQWVDDPNYNFMY